jgi:hypothetical protein
MKKLSMFLCVGCVLSVPVMAAKALTIAPAVIVDKTAEETKVPAKDTKAPVKDAAVLAEVSKKPISCRVFEWSSINISRRTCICICE